MYLRSSLFFQRDYMDRVPARTRRYLKISDQRLIAVRMRVAGHDQAAIESAIRQCAPDTRQKDEGRDWDDYARRTARYALSFAGDRQADDLMKYRQQWEKLEGREQIRQEQNRQQVHERPSRSMGH
jgi:hypothetical protein